MQDVIRKHLNDFAAGNWNEYRAALANNVVYEEIATRQRVQGPDEYLNLVKRWKTAFPDLRANVIEVNVVGDRVIAEVEWVGTHRGQLEAPFGTIPATNKSGSIRAALVYKIENGKIREGHHYFDLFSLMMQLGLAPPIGVSAAGGASVAQATKRT